MSHLLFIIQEYITNKFEITRIDMKPGNRMLRVCLYGQHEGKGFVRVDLWSVGYRITKK
ncbi:hypothetical protein FDJ06_gp024 [Pseudomonas phage SL2]|uniref:Uncharacterized protein n=1 Tax=Pseudomonas phage SL2 TaxID=2041345 RepID=A0A2D1GQJ1_9CAUD|nr:hypothetical protein FDJ06_gp024 [Pseudomonas phage SL2]ATN94601.1 hypothetical protein SL2_024 [Pseudomonas phage SL2]